MTNPITTDIVQDVKKIEGDINTDISSLKGQATADVKKTYSAKIVGIVFIIGFIVGYVIKFL